MPTTTSFPTANDDSFGQADNWQADDGTTGRLRQSQTYIFSSFSGLSIPAGSTILGIEVLMEGYASTTTLDDPLVFVSNDNGSSFSDGKDASTEPWSTDSSAFQVEIAGGAADTWGLSWNATTAAAIQVKFNIPTQSTAIFLDFTQVRITYEESSPYTGEPNLTSSDGTIILKAGSITIK